MIAGVTRVRCPGCDRESECKLVQSINAVTDASAKARLLAGELNVLDCACGRRTQLAATLLFYDPVAEYWCQVCPGDEQAMAQGEAAFRAAGTGGTQRLVPSLNALIEKVRMLDAGLEDWAIEMVKVLLLASRAEVDDRGLPPGGSAAEGRRGVIDLERVLLFDGIDHDTIRWLVFEDGSARVTTSPLAAYTKLAARTQGRPGPRELRIDRAWAVAAVRTMIAAAN